MDNENVRTIMDRMEKYAMVHGSKMWRVKANDKRVKRRLRAKERTFMLAAV